MQQFTVRAVPQHGVLVAVRLYHGGPRQSRGPPVLVRSFVDQQLREGTELTGQALDVLVLRHEIGGVGTEDGDA
ncbi:hypothetical protein [Streptomyces sp. NPDC056255]|uniref:hypothetical protein n=1 Tax=Streptomyces sp. NPDC056255 TaxID=3345764 RepID=UPI0035DCF253